MAAGAALREFHAALSRREWALEQPRVDRIHTLPRRIGGLWVRPRHKRAARDVHLVAVPRVLQQRGSLACLGQGQHALWVEEQHQLTICIGAPASVCGDSTICAYGGAYAWKDFLYSPPLPSENMADAGRSDDDLASSTATHAFIPSNRT